MVEVKCNILNPRNEDDGKYYPMSETSGETSYQIAVRNGYEGTEADWKKETSGTVEYVDTAGIANKSMSFKDTSVGSETQPVFINSKGQPTAIGFTLGNSCELNATDNIEVEERAVATTFALQKALLDLFAKAIVPTVNGINTYDGTLQSPEFLNYDERLVSAKGTLKATNAGNYTAIFEPISPYTWEDGTNDEIDVKWRIEKAECAVYLSSSSVVIGDNNDNYTINISRLGDGGILLSNTNPEVIDVELDGNKINITGNGISGKSMVGVKVKEGTNYKESNTIYIEVTANYSLV